MTTLFGRSMKDEAWVKVETWSETEYSAQTSNDAIEEFSEEHFTGKYSSLRVDWGEE